MPAPSGGVAIGCRGRTWCKRNLAAALQEEDTAAAAPDYAEEEASQAGRPTAELTEEQEVWELATASIKNHHATR